MPEPVPVEHERSPDAESVEIFEEQRWSDSRLLGLFELRIIGGGELLPSGAPGWEDVLGDDDFDDLADDADYSEAAWAERNATREAAEVAADEACGQADPHRRLTIDQAIALARTYADTVTIWLDHEPWDGSRVPRGGVPPWPPPNLDLRPRWEYEPADASRHDQWWVRFSVSKAGLTPAIARVVAEGLPSILSVRSAKAVRKGRWPRSVFRSETVTLECLVVHTDERSADDADLLIGAINKAVPDRARTPWRIRIAVLRDTLMRRHDRHYYFMGSSTSVSPSVIGPATADDLP